MTLYTVVLFDGEEAYTERLISENSTRGKKKVMDYVNTYGMDVLHCEPYFQNMTIDELDKALQDTAMRNRYISMYCI